MLRKWMAVFLLFLALAVCASAETLLSGTVRVYLSSLNQLTQAHVTLSGAYALGNDIYPAGTALTLTNQGGRLYLNGTQQGTGFRLLRQGTSSQDGLRIAEARYPDSLYPGDLEVRAKGGNLQLIVHVFVEDYMAGVLPYEMDDSFPMEALKAQAVAARTYTLRKMSLQAPLYDVVDTTSDQVYNGTGRAQDNCLRAVSETAGTVGLSGGAYMASYYTASNGGQTETVKNAWGSGSYPYLTMHDDPYDLKNPASMSKSVSFYRNGKTSQDGLTALLAAEAADALGQKTARVSGISDVRLSSPKYGPESRVFQTVEVDVEVEGRGKVSLKLDYFTQVEGLCQMSLNVLQNETLDVTQTVGGFKLTARRFGHGVGLSQRGAQQMALEGRTFEEILSFYYPGTSLRTFTLIGPGESGAGEEEMQGAGVVTLKNPLDSLNLRREPSLSAPVLAMIPYGTRVNILSRSSGFYRVQYGTLNGFVSEQYLKEEKQEQSSKGANTVTVSLADDSQVLNLRASPTVNAPVLGYLRSGQVLTVLGRYTRWTQVRFGMLTGYVMNDYIREEAQTEPETESVQQGRSGQTAIVLPGSGLNMRLSRDPASPVLLVLPQGTSLKVRGASEGRMLPVALGSLSGYVSLQYVYLMEAATPVPQATPSPAPTAAVGAFGTVTAQNGLILRTGPARQADAVLLLPLGTRVELTGAAVEGFYPCRVGGQDGYVSGEYLNVEGEQYLPKATEPAPQKTPVPASRVVSGGRTGIVTASGGLNLRSLPNSSGEVLSVLEQNQEVTILGEAQGGFYPVRAGQLTGYLSASYVKIKEEGTEETTAHSQSMRVAVNTRNGLNLRAAPSLSSEVLYIVPDGMVLDVLEEAADGFLHVRWANYEGYVSGQFVTPIGAQ